MENESKLHVKVYFRIRPRWSDLVRIQIVCRNIFFFTYLLHTSTVPQVFILFAQHDVSAWITAKIVEELFKLGEVLVKRRWCCPKLFSFPGSTFGLEKHITEEFCNKHEHFLEYLLKVCGRAVLIQHVLVAFINSIVRILYGRIVVDLWEDVISIKVLAEPNFPRLNMRIWKYFTLFNSEFYFYYDISA